MNLRLILLQFCFEKVLTVFFQLVMLLQRLLDHVPVSRIVETPDSTPKRTIHTNLDLQRASAEELAEYKRLMEKDFSAHHVRPGDPDFEYDKQVWFAFLSCAAFAVRF